MSHSGLRYPLRLCLTISWWPMIRADVLLLHRLVFGRDTVRVGGVGNSWGWFGVEQAGAMLVRTHPSVRYQLRPILSTGTEPLLPMILSSGTVSSYRFCVPALVVR